MAYKNTTCKCLAQLDEWFRSEQTLKLTVLYTLLYPALKGLSRNWIVEIGLMGHPTDELSPWVTKPQIHLDFIEYKD